MAHDPPVVVRRVAVYHCFNRIMEDLRVPVALKHGFEITVDEQSSLDLSVGAGVG